MSSTIPLLFKKITSAVALHAPKLSVDSTDPVLATPAGMGCAYTRRDLVHHGGSFFKIYFKKELPEESGRLLFLKIETSAGLLGARVTSRSGVTIPVLQFPVLSRSAELMLFVPQDVAAVSLLNLSEETEAGDLIVRDMSFRPYGSLPPVGRDEVRSLIRNSRSTVFIHTPGKTGSVTVERNLQKHKKVICGRDHFISYPGFFRSNTRYARGMIAQSDASLIFKRNKSFHFVRAMLEEERETHIVCGVRRSADLAVAAYFQNFGDSLVAGDASADAAIPRVESHCASALGGEGAIDHWWSYEFESVYGDLAVDILGKLTKDGLVWRFRVPGSHASLLFYRVEDGAPAIQQILETVRKAPVDAVDSFNVGAKKRYAPLYSDVKKTIDRDALQKHRSDSLKTIDAFFYGPDLET